MVPQNEATLRLSADLQLTKVLEIWILEGRGSGSKVVVQLYVKAAAKVCTKCTSTANLLNSDDLL